MVVMAVRVVRTVWTVRVVRAVIQVSNNYSPPPPPFEPIFLTGQSAVVNLVQHQGGGGQTKLLTCKATTLQQRSRSRSM